MNINLKESKIDLIDSQVRPDIILRYYKGWPIVFSSKHETFNCPILSLYGYSSSADLQKTVDKVTVDKVIEIRKL